MPFIKAMPGFSILLTLIICGCALPPPVSNNHTGLWDLMLEFEQRGARSGTVEHKYSLGVNYDGKLAMSWPLKKNAVTSNFGKRGTDHHEGIDLRAELGTAVYSAHDGVVMYADDRIGGYGNMVVLRHKSGISTIYAHNSKLFVHTGQKVERGAKIALSGDSGRSMGPHLHFEVWRGEKPVNPVPYLP
ncbi:MAG: M23 family metallopeptidase [Bdellovibrionota bacterium]